LAIVTGAPAVAVAAGAGDEPWEGARDWVYELPPPWPGRLAVAGTAKALGLIRSAAGVNSVPGKKTTYERTPAAPASSMASTKRCHSGGRIRILADRLCLPETDIFGIIADTCPKRSHPGYTTRSGPK